MQGIQSDRLGTLSILWDSSIWDYSPQSTISKVLRLCSLSKGDLSSTSDPQPPRFEAQFIHPRYLLTRYGFIIPNLGYTQFTQQARFWADRLPNQEHVWSSVRLWFFYPMEIYATKRWVLFWVQPQPLQVFHRGLSSSFRKGDLGSDL